MENKKTQEVIAPISLTEQKDVLLQPAPRRFTVEDVTTMQKYLQETHDDSVRKNHSCRFHSEGVYVKLISGEGENNVELPADRHSFDNITKALLSQWNKCSQFGVQTPQTLEEARQQFIRTPELNRQSPIHFQNGPEDESSFVHVITARAMYKNRESSTLRYYLNPTADKMGYVVEELTAAALYSEVPLQFKFVNVTTRTPKKWTMSRSDRVVVYASEGQVEFIEGVLARIVDGAPEAFAGRKVSGFGEVIADGITKADDVTKEQNQRFKRKSQGVSFNSLRAELVYRATLDVMKELIVSPNTQSVEVDGKTIRQKFVGELTECIGERMAGIVIKDDDPTLLKALSLGLSSELLEQDGGFTDVAIRAVNDAVNATARDILPRIRPDHLLGGYDRHIKCLAPKYGINPDNLAQNIPIAD